MYYTQVGVCVCADGELIHDYRKVGVCVCVNLCP